MCYEEHEVFDHLRDLNTALYGVEEIDGDAVCEICEISELDACMLTQWGQQPTSEHDVPRVKVHLIQERQE